MGQSKYAIMTWLSLPIFVTTVQNNWKTSRMKSDFSTETNAPRILTRKMEPLLNTCSLYKTVMDQHTFYQYIQYNHHIPPLNEFTLCVWHKLYNYSLDHSLFSYTLPPKQRAIFSRITNTPKESYYTLSVNDHTLYRIKYPIKLFKWYHLCQSWNGNTGEWQVWINNERIARGYYNLMVGKAIKSGGIAISGQEFINQDVIFNYKKNRIGLQGELTLLQLYRAALSKGKAYSDHKHHHGRNAENGDNLYSKNTVTFLEMPQDLTTEHPLIENGQIKPHLPIHELVIETKPKPTYDMQMPPPENQDSDIFLEFNEPLPSQENYPYAHFSYTNNNRIKIKRDNSLTTIKNDIVDAEISTTAKLSDIKKTSSNHALKYGQFAKLKKEDKVPENKSDLNERVLLTFENNRSPSDFTSSSGSLYVYSKASGNRHTFKNGPNIDQKNFYKLEYEPAEWEIRHIAEICNACEEDPFSRANVLSWQETPKKLFAGARYIPTVSKCHNF